MTQGVRKDQDERKPKTKIAEIDTVKMEEPTEVRPLTLYDQLETETTNRVHATFGTNQLKFHQTLLTLERST